MRGAIDATERIGGGLDKAGMRRKPVLELCSRKRIIPEDLPMISATCLIVMRSEEFYLEIVVNDMGTLHG